MLQAWNRLDLYFLVLSVQLAWMQGFFLGYKVYVVGCEIKITRKGVFH